MVLLAFLVKKLQITPTNLNSRRNLNLLPSPKVIKNEIVDTYLNSQKLFRSIIMRYSNNYKGVRMSKDNPKIIYTETDEAPALATDRKSTRLNSSHR